MKSIAVGTTTRADLGLLTPLIKLLSSDTEIDLKVLITGSHLLPEFGSTVNEIDFIPEREKVLLQVEMEDDSPGGVSKSLGAVLFQTTQILEELRPEILVLLGDRYETLGMAIAAQLTGTRVGHIHGGETTLGAMDESFRHSITKMSHLHFAAAAPYRNRIIQLGELGETVHLVGGLGVDAILQTKLISRERIEKELGIKFRERNLLVTFHPETLNLSSTTLQISILLEVLSQLINTTIIFTMPNADPGNQVIKKSIDQFVSAHSNSYVFDSLGSQLYLSCLSLVDGVVGNSSSGLLEAPTMRVGTVNIGNRQLGRLSASSVINCSPTKDAITEAIRCLYSQEFQETLKSVANPYGEGGASLEIYKILKSTPLDQSIFKHFNDLSPSVLD
jgi:GDP/UDP-N,N'-diacetylbacillosamine 2-epimerase (hydrolysing)